MTTRNDDPHGLDACPDPFTCAFNHINDEEREKMRARLAADFRRMTSVEVEECTVAHYRKTENGGIVLDPDECSRVKARKARCASGLHNYVVPRSYVQIGPKRYVQVCFQCGQTDYMNGEAPE